MNRVRDACTCRAKVLICAAAIGCGGASPPPTGCRAARNPQALSTQAVDGDAIYVADAGDWSDAEETNAGIERLDTAALTSALLADERTLGGSPATVAVRGGCGAAIVADASTVNRTSLVVFPLDEPSRATVAFGPTAGFDLRGLLWMDGELLVGDAEPSGAAGYPVHVFSVGAGCALTPKPDLLVPSLPPLGFATTT